MEGEVWERTTGSEGIGSLLRDVGLSREVAASRLGVSTDSINNWCSGRTLMSLRNLGRLAEILREAGTPRDILHNLLATQLVRLGMDRDVVDLLCNGGDEWMESGPIVVLGSQFYSGSHQLMIVGFHDAMRVAGIEDVAYLDTCGSKQVLDYYIALALRSPLRGAVFVGFDSGEQRLYEMLSELASRSIPCVFVGTGPAAPPAGTGVVHLDGYRGAAVATETLWSRGHRDIIALAIDRRVPQIDKVQGYTDAIERLGGRSRVVWTLLPDAGSQPAATADRPDLHEAAELVVSDPDARAVLALSSHAVKGVMSALHSTGRGPMPEVSLMALGCWDWMHYVSSPPITHVVLPYYEAGQQAAAMVLALGNDDLTPERREVVVPLPDSALHESINGTIFNLS